MTDLMASLVSSSSTAVLSPWSTLNTPAGSPASFHSSAIHSEADGSFSDGLSTTVLPAAMAMGKNHIGTMAGKLNGEMMADRAQRLADGVDVDLGRGVLGEPALE